MANYKQPLISNLGAMSGNLLQSLDHFAPVVNTDSAPCYTSLAQEPALYDTRAVPFPDNAAFNLPFYSQAPPFYPTPDLKRPRVDFYSDAPQSLSTSEDKNNNAPEFWSTRNPASTSQTETSEECRPFSRCDLEELLDLEGVPGAVMSSSLLALAKSYDSPLSDTYTSSDEESAEDEKKDRLLERVLLACEDEDSLDELEENAEEDKPDSSSKKRSLANLMSRLAHTKDIDLAPLLKVSLNHDVKMLDCVREMFQVSKLLGGYE
ncbi:hypothetical protein Ciccas_002329 [Cichlidogyrus casuarinus]|uniref:Uncharacterized protein n=1 Tax=Cichlidogyrus casuarinus TaxID=1844966 RepID=A0ABD2QHJ2_9PLAT